MSGHVTESEIQRRIIQRYESAGWLVVKIGLCNKNGFPDLMMLKDGKAMFVEVKRPGERPRPLQIYRQEELKAKGFEVLTLTQ